MRTLLAVGFVLLGGLVVGGIAVCSRALERRLFGSADRSRSPRRSRSADRGQAPRAGSDRGPKAASTSPRDSAARANARTRRSRGEDESGVRRLDEARRREALDDWRRTTWQPPGGPDA